MQIAALRHTEMVGELVMLQVTVSSAMEFALGRSLDETLRVKVVDELVIEIQKLEEWRLCLEQPGTGVYDLLLRLPSSQARLHDRLEEATGRLGPEIAAQWEADAELEAL
jgi:hypothetical protein